MSTVVIGLDGASFDVLNPLIQAGHVPNIKKIINTGTSGTLWSSIPPVTAPAWISMATGMTPGKTGVYDFLKNTGANFYLKGVNYSDFSGMTIWDVLSRLDRKVCVLNYPMAYPAAKVNGILTGGIGTPDEKYTYPPALQNEIYSILGEDYLKEVYYHREEYSDRELFKDNVLKSLGMQKQLVDAFHDREEWSLFWIVISHSDWTQHYLWTEFEKWKAGGFSEDMELDFIQLWKEIDDVVGDIYEHFYGNNIFIVSDHGFGANNSCFKLNAWLEKEGYLKRHEKDVSWKARFTRFRLFFLKAIKSLSGTNRFDEKIDRWEILTSSEANKLKHRINWKESIAFDPGHTIPMGCIYLNEKFFRDKTEREEELQVITDKLERFCHDRGENVRVYQPEKLYNDKSGKSPDLIIGFNNWGGSILKNEFDGDIIEHKSYSDQHTGAHRENGVFIANGPDIFQGKSKFDSSIFDIAPTLLYASGVEPPQYMEGRILRSIFKPGFRESNTYEFAPHSDSSESDHTELSSEEQQELESRLQGLGYM